MKKHLRSYAVLPALVLLLSQTISLPAANQPYKKLDSHLQAFVGGSSVVPLADSSSSAAGVFKDSLQPIMQGKRMQVEIRLNTSNPDAVKTLEEKGLKISSRFEGLVTGFATSDDLLQLASLDIVSTIRPFYRPLLRSIPGEGVETLRADLVHNSTDYPYDGTGVKIGIISDSFGMVSEATPVVEDIDGDGINEIYGTDSQLSGDVPEVIELLEEGKGNRDDFTDEGRGMAEILHEMAPGAELAFNSAFNGLSGFANGIIALATSGCKIIVDDVFYLEEPFYQDGEVCKAVRKVARDYDVVYLTAHGNSGAKAIEGIFRDINPDRNDGQFQKLPTGNDLHNWLDGRGAPNPFLSITIMPGSTAILAMNWENPFSGTLGKGASTDYDLYFLSKPSFDLSSIITSSSDYQGAPDTPQGDPLEVMSITNTTDQPQIAYLALNKHHGPDVPFKIIFFRGDIKISDTIRSADAIVYTGHNKVNELLSIAAVNYYEAATNGLAQNNPNRIDPASYSSNGGTLELLYDGDGKPFPDPVKVFKPDFASVDGTNTSFFYADAGFDKDEYPNFYGTSAAAPHAAAIAAMMRQANPSLKAPEIRDLMRAAATDIFLPGIDTYTGTGLLYADNAIAAVPDKIKPGLKPTSTPTMTPKPTPTPTPTPVPVITEYGVIITDTLKTTKDLSNSVDYDKETERILSLRWNLPVTDIKEYHIYVSLNGGTAKFLGLQTDPASNFFEWKEGNPFTAGEFSVGPKFGNTYQFMVFVLTQSGTPHHFGPYQTAGPVEYLESK